VVKALKLAARITVDGIVLGLIAIEALHWAQIMIARAKCR
jgi:hypothetical protein